MNDRLRILQLIESGEISVEEGVQLLEELHSKEAGQQPGDEAREASGDAAGVGEPMMEPAQPRFVQIIWQMVFGVGIAVLAGGGLLLTRAYSREGMPGLAWGWVLFTLGLLVMMLGWWLQRARWFYLRVREHDGAAFTIAVPLPLSPVVWLLRVAKPFVPQLQEMDLDQLVLLMRDELRQGRCFALDVDEGEDGDRVEIYFG